MGLIPKSIFLTFAAAGLAACATVEEQSPIAELSAVDQPEWQVGYTLVQKDVQTGEEGGWTILAVEGDRITAQSTRGCRWVNSTDWFAPTLEWENCGGFTGSREITEREGAIWPLQVGNRAKYEFINSDGRRGTRRCEVDSTVNISVAEELIDAYKVVCRQDKRTRTWYWSPERGEVKYTNVHADRGVTDYYDQVRTEIRSGS